MTKKMMYLVLVAAVLLSVSSKLFGGGGAQKPSKELRVALDWVVGAGDMDPIATGGGDYMRLGMHIYEPLIFLNEDGEYVPGLATSWESNEDYTVWTIKLREGVQFHGDWGEMTAEDVKFSIERFMSPEARQGTEQQLRDQVKEVVIVDQYTLEIRLNVAGVNWVTELLAHAPAGVSGVVMSKKYWESVGADGFRTHPIGTGRWEFEELRPGDAIITKAFNKHWSGVLPGFERLILMEVPEEGARIAMLKRGEADLILVNSVDNARRLDEEGYSLLIVRDVIQTGMPIWGSWHPKAIEENMPLSHLKVRKALSLAINRQEITETMFGGLYEPAFGIVGGYALSSVDVDVARWEEWAKVNLRYDPERAKELLVEAGFPDGFEFSIWSFPMGRGTWQPELIEALAGYWAEIGVTTNIIASDWYGYLRPLTRMKPQEQAEEITCTANLWSLGVERYPLTRIGVFWVHEGSFGLFGPYPLFEDLYAKTLAETDPDLRFKYTNDLIELCAESWLGMNIFHGSQTYILADSVSIEESAAIPGLAYPNVWLHKLKPAAE